MTYQMIQIDVNGIELDAVVEFDYTPNDGYELHHVIVNLDDGAANAGADWLLLDRNIEQSIIDKLEEALGGATYGQ